MPEVNYTLVTIAGGGQDPQCRQRMRLKPIEERSGISLR
jgi:hypothetical protein